MLHSDECENFVDFGSIYGGVVKKNRIKSPEMSKIIRILIHWAEINKISYIHLNLKFMEFRLSISTTYGGSLINPFASL